MNTGSKYTFEIVDNEFRKYARVMRLIIKAVASTDFGDYHCVAKNSVGDDDRSVKLYG